MTMLFLIYVGVPVFLFWAACRVFLADRENARAIRRELQQKAREARSFWEEDAQETDTMRIVRDVIAKYGLSPKS